MNQRILRLGVIAFGCIACAALSASADAARTSLRAVLQTPGGELPFRLDLTPASAGKATAVIHNGREQIEIKDAEFSPERLVVPFGYFGSRIEATSSDGGATWRGAWTKTGRGGKESRLDFSATPYAGYRFAPLPPANEPATDDPTPGEQTPTADITGRWDVAFAQSAEPTIGEFKVAADGTADGTFLTPGGDYRYLAGVYTDNRLRLSTFDGSHAFLFDARFQPDGTLAGGFWAGNAWHETWTARRAPDAKLPDGFNQAHALGKADLANLHFADLAGNAHTLADMLGDSQACILEVFGSWCPNCHDASRLLDELQAKYADRGLRVIGLAFEYTGDVQQDAQRIRDFMAHCHVTYPVLYGGFADREQVARKLPFLDGLKAYPTTIFLRADGAVAAVHTGFSGPATEDYPAQRAAFERVIEQMLPDPSRARHQAD
ncbi:MAG TPA: TlpA disulfide reductase family protein [Phycisphaerae bacterium]|nr:TlpA family protein disulfide reductase [Phycisphaerales bacterium]HRX83750.1 TlpA disulfide reductase family protein [Phycisphaerae bacterium]